jgi:hypothetical protein
MTFQKKLVVVRRNNSHVFPAPPPHAPPRDRLLLQTDAGGQEMKQSWSKIRNIACAGGEQRMGLRGHEGRSGMARQRHERGHDE